jgi:hypothetical protein
VLAGGSLGQEVREDLSGVGEGGEVLQNLRTGGDAMAHNDYVPGRGCGGRRGCGVAAVGI